MSRLLRLGASAASKERRLESLLSGRDPGILAKNVECAQVLGSLELSGLKASWEEVLAAREGGSHEEAQGLFRALRLPPEEFGAGLLLRWRAALQGGEVGFRETPHEREPPTCPPFFISSRVSLLAEWVNAPSSSELRPWQLGALVLARIAEIRPFEDANGRIARLAASQAIVRRGGRPPILVAADAPRLREALSRAFELETAPLSMLLEEASERALDVMIQTLTTPG